MSKVTAHPSISLDGFMAGPEPSGEHPLGKGGEQLHEWAVATRTFKETHGTEDGGEVNVDDEVVRRWVERADATIMGRRMYSGGEGPWEEDPRARGWWVMSLPSTTRSSSSPTTPASRSRWRAARPSTS